MADHTLQKISMHLDYDDFVVGTCNSYTKRRPNAILGLTNHKTLNK